MAPTSSTVEVQRGAVSWGAHTGALLDRSEGFRVLECTSCGFRHVVPLPSEHELRRVYRHDYYAVAKPLYLERSREDEPWWSLVHRERFEAFEALLAAGRRRVLDVGCGPGTFLSVGRERGWEVLGIEPSEQAAAHARSLGLPVVEEFLTPELAPRLGTFDAVHLNEVLEHLPDPRGHLELCRDLLRPAGLLCVAVPNDYNPLQAVLREVAGYAPWWVAPPHHLNYFDFDSLARLLERVGFAILRREATFPLEIFLLMGEDYVHDDGLGRACHARRKLFETRLDAAGAGGLKRELYARLAELGLGRQALLYAEKR